MSDQGKLSIFIAMTLPTRKTNFEGLTLGPFKNLYLLVEHVKQ
jgi:hypothetical protein